jgi:hypothetical protein
VSLHGMGLLTYPCPREVIEYINDNTENRRADLVVETEAQEPEPLPEDDIANQQQELIIPVGGEDELEGDGNDEAEIDVDDGGDGLINQLQGQPVEEVDSPGPAGYGDVAPVEYVPDAVVNEVVNDVQDYFRVEGAESAIRPETTRESRDASDA